MNDHVVDEKLKTVKTSKNLNIMTFNSSTPLTDFLFFPCFNRPVHAVNALHNPSPKRAPPRYVFPAHVFSVSSQFSLLRSVVFQPLASYAGRLYDFVLSVFGKVAEKYPRESEGKFPASLSHVCSFNQPSIFNLIVQQKQVLSNKTRLKIVSRKKKVVSV